MSSFRYIEQNLKLCYFVLILVPLPWADGVVLHTVTFGRKRVNVLSLYTSFVKFINNTNKSYDQSMGST